MSAFRAVVGDEHELLHTSRPGAGDGPHGVARYNAEDLPWLANDRQKAVEKPRRRRLAWFFVISLRLPYESASICTIRPLSS
jgi:hypothetical protein